VLVAKAPDPASAKKLTRAQILAVLGHAGRYKIAEWTDAILTALRSPQLGQAPRAHRRVRGHGAVPHRSDCHPERSGQGLAGVGGHILASTRTLRSTCPGPA
jgi:hypothetical protein